MLTEKQSEIFREILDLNWDLGHADLNGKAKFEMAKKLGAKKKELIESMGSEAYYEFIRMGQLMFAPADN